jgi:two-component system NarL family response regulator
VEKIRVIIADDDATFRRLLHEALLTDSDIEVVAQAADGEEAIALAGEFAPHVILLDVRMPNLGGVEAAKVLHEIHPTVRVLMLTISDEADDVFHAVRGGASGYLLKDTSVDDVADAIRKIHRGRAVLSRSIAPLLLSELTSWVREDDLPALRPPLTKRELEVLQHLAGGQSTDTVANELGISVSVVDAHVHNVLMKLQNRERMRGVMTAVLAGEGSRDEA